MLPGILFEFRAQGAVAHDMERSRIARGRPGGQESTRALFRRKPAHKKRIAAIAIALAGIGIHEVRFN